MTSSLTYRPILRHLWRHIVALGLVGAGFLLCLSIPQVFFSRPFLAFWPVVVLAAVLGGKGPGALATVASALCVEFIIYPNYGGMDLHEWIGMTAMGIFLVGGLAISIFIGEKLKINSLLRLQAAAAANEVRYRSLFEVVNVGKSVTLPTGEKIQVNRAFCDMLGYGPEDMRGKTWQELTPPEEIGPINEQLAPLLRGEKDAVRFEKRYIHKNGSYIWADVSTVVQRDGGGKPQHFITTVVDITERKRAEQREHTRLQVLELVAKNRPLPEILETMVRRMEVENPVMVGSILLLDEEERHLLYGAAPSLPESFSRAIHGAAIGPCAGSCGTAAFRGERVIVSDIAGDPLWADYRALILPHGFKACWSQPILSSTDRVLGTFAMYYRAPRSPTLLDLNIINAAAHIAAIAIEHERDRQALTTAYQQLESKEAKLKQTLDALVHSETKYRTMFESASDAVMLFDGKIILDCNNATLRTFGCQSRDQFIGTHPAAWTPAGEDAQQLAKAQLDKALKEGSARFEAARQRRNGSQFPAEVWLTRMKMDDKPMILATVRDISERKAAEQALQVSEARLRTIFEQASDGIFLISADNHYLDVNAFGLELFGYTREEFLQMSVADILVPHEHPRLEVELKEMLAGKPHLAEWEHLRKDGSTFPAEVSASSLNNQTYLAIVRDLTERRRAETMLRESEERLRLAQNAAHIGTFDWDVPNNHITWSRWHEEMWGFKSGEFGGTYQAFSERVHPEDLPGINAEVARCIAAREPFEHEFRVIWPDGSVHWIQSRGEFNFDHDSQPLRMRGAVLEVTERKQAGIALLKSQQQLRKVIDGLGPNTFLGLMTPDGTLVEANLSALVAADLKPEDVLGKPFWDARWWSYSELVQERLRQAIHGAAEGNGCRYDVQVCAVEDQLIDIDFSIEPVFDDIGKVEYLVPSANIITERKQAENQLHQLNLELEQRVQDRTRELTAANTKLQELDSLKSLFIASMSHELRTPLNSIIGFTGIILQGMSGEINPEQRKQLGIVKNNARHLLALINDIIDVSKIESGAIELADEAFDLSSLVQEVSQALATVAAGKNLMLTLQVPPLLVIRSDRRRLKQILINLLDNAIKFTDVGGVTIELTLQDARMILSVRDSGIGIDTQHQHRLFQAFSQIAPPSGQVHQGTGLGLYLSQRLAHLLGGDITLTSTMGVGSCFTLILPYRRNPYP